MILSSPFLLPLAPKDIISIPIIRSVIANITANKTKPNLIGLAITRIDTATLNTPVPMIKALENLDISLDIPCTILAIPLINSATPPTIIKNPVVSIGNSIRKIERPITTTPSAIFVTRVFLVDEREDTPIAILSIPTIKNTMERKRIIVNRVFAGKMTKNDSTTIESKIAIEPNMICNIRSHGGDLLLTVSTL
jgi:hypothetical protein